VSARPFAPIALTLALACAACGPTVEDVCEGLLECPDPVGADCVEDGKTIEKRADRNCEDEFTDYLECLDEAGCNWRDRCEGSRDTVIDCAGELPE
jgi:hypothetical protein